jgi:hypothetical protein
LIDDPSYLKRFVREHPDNQMGWYLLGKHYEREGKGSKALYCFNRSGEVYEAFEKDPAGTVSPAHVREWKESTSRQRGIILRVAFMLVIIALILVYIPDSQLLTSKDQAAADQVPSETTPAVISRPLPTGTKVYYLNPMQTKSAWDAALNALIRPGADRNAYSVVANAPVSKDGRHRAFRGADRRFRGACGTLP